MVSIPDEVRKAKELMKRGRYGEVRRNILGVFRRIEEKRIRFPGPLSPNTKELEDILREASERLAKLNYERLKRILGSFDGMLSKPLPDTESELKSSVGRTKRQLEQWAGELQEVIDALSDEEKMDAIELLDNAARSIERYEIQQMLNEIKKKELGDIGEALRLTREGCERYPHSGKLSRKYRELVERWSEQRKQQLQQLLESGNYKAAYELADGICKRAKDEVGMSVDTSFAEGVKWDIEKRQRECKSALREARKLLEAHDFEAAKEKLGLAEQAPLGLPEAEELKVKVEEHVRRNERAGMLLNKASEAVASGDFKKAMAHFREVCNIAPWQAEYVKERINEICRKHSLRAFTIPFGAERYRFVLGAPFTVGRMEEVLDAEGRFVRENRVVYRCGDISRVHATIEYTGSDFRIKDDGSMNGTYIDDRKVVSSMVLADDCVIKLGGSTSIRFLRFRSTHGECAMLKLVRYVPSYGDDPSLIYVLVPGRVRIGRGGILAQDADKYVDVMVDGDMAYIKTGDGARTPIYEGLTIEVGKLMLPVKR